MFSAIVWNSCDGFYSFHRTAPTLWKLSFECCRRIDTQTGDEQSGGLTTRKAAHPAHISCVCVCVFFYFLLGPRCSPGKTSDFWHTAWDCCVGSSCEHEQCAACNDVTISVCEGQETPRKAARHLWPLRWACRRKCHSWLCKYEQQSHVFLHHRLPLSLFLKLCDKLHLFFLTELDEQLAPNRQM